MNNTEQMDIWMDFGVSEDCVNPNSYGMICVKCRQCGRKFSTDTQESDTRKEDADV